MVSAGNKSLFSLGESFGTWNDSRPQCLPKHPDYNHYFLLGQVVTLCVWAAAEASANARFLMYLDLLSEGDGGDEVRACALVERFVEAREMAHSLLVLEDID